MFSKSKPFNYYVNVNLFISTTINDFHCAIESAKVDSISRGPSAQHKDTESSITFKWRFRFNDFTARKSAVRKLQSDYNRSWKCYTQLVFVSIVLENTHTQFAVVKRFRELMYFFGFVFRRVWIEKVTLAQIKTVVNSSSAIKRNDEENTHKISFSIIEPIKNRKHDNGFQ